MHIRQFNPADLGAVLGIETAAWGSEAANAEQIMARATVCPEGSIVAEHLNGDIVGYAAAQRVNQLSTQSWATVTDNGCITTSHKPEGKIAFGVGMSVLSTAARFGVSGAIIKRYAEIFVGQGDCQSMALGSRLPGFSRWTQQHGGTVQDYLGHARKGLSIDPELCLYEKAGFHLMWPVAEYFPDAKSCNWGAIIALDRRTALKMIAPTNI
jgi:hypothetical protein